EFPLRCPSPEGTTIADRTYPTTHNYPTRSSNITCPFYFRWIHEDLRHWKVTGITREMVERGRRSAHFRLIVVGGKAYVEKYRQALQTRDVYTLWGILQLLRWYPGRVPDFELLFDCDDRPVVRAKDFRGDLTRRNSSSPPVLFHYCGDEDALGVVFPDWTFWGWGETNIKPWKSVVRDINEKSKKSKWEDRVPSAYWKGNPNVSAGRFDLMTCNISNGHQDWHTHLYRQEWGEEERNGFAHSKLEDQCTHRYKIYIEGYGWSVSEKYIMACDSMTLLVKPQFHDFFTRGLMPLRHYWPIRPENKCRDIKFAVEWGNSNPNKARGIGESGSRFMKKDLKMENVYDYMLHTLTQYAKLLRFKPKLPQGFEPGDELRSETIACSWEGVWREFMLDSAVESPSSRLPCSMSADESSDHDRLLEISKRRREIERRVEKLEDEYYNLGNN
ncbi:Protein O-glucosyltransferase 1, partial [Linum grandiflorum]